MSSMWDNKDKPNSNSPPNYSELGVLTQIYLSVSCFSDVCIVARVAVEVVWLIIGGRYGCE